MFVWRGRSCPPALISVLFDFLANFAEVSLRSLRL